MEENKEYQDEFTPLKGKLLHIKEELRISSEKQSRNSINSINKAPY